MRAKTDYFFRLMRGPGVLVLPLFIIFMHLLCPAPPFWFYLILDLFLHPRSDTSDTLDTPDTPDTPTLDTPTRSDTTHASQLSNHPQTPVRHRPDTSDTVDTSVNRHRSDTAPTLLRHLRHLRHSDTSGLKSQARRRPRRLAPERLRWAGTPEAALVLK